MNSWKRTVVLAAGLSIVGLVVPARGIISCNTQTNISSSTTLTDDFEKTNQTFTPCIAVSGANTVVNMNGHKIICKSTTGTCGPAFNVSTNGALVRNGEIVGGLNASGQPAAWNTGFQCFNFGSGLWTDCEVSNMLVEATGSCIAGGKEVDTTVCKGADVCIDSVKTLTNGGFYRENYCSATETGFLVTGPGGGGTFTIERNYVRASTGTGVEVEDGNATLEHNIIDAATPIDDTNGDTVTLTENICSDTADCPEPTERGFTLNVDFD